MFFHSLNPTSCLILISLSESHPRSRALSQAPLSSSVVTEEEASFGNPGRNHIKSIQPAYAANPIAVAIQSQGSRGQRRCRECQGQGSLEGGRGRWGLGFERGLGPGAGGGGVLVPGGAAAAQVVVEPGEGLEEAAVGEDGAARADEAERLVRAHACEHLL